MVTILLSGCWVQCPLYQIRNCMVLPGKGKSIQYFIKCCYHTNKLNIPIDSIIRQL